MEQITQQEQRPGLLGRLRSEFSFVEGNFLIMVVSWLVLDFFVELPGTYYALYVEALGGTAAIIGLIGAAQMVANAVVQIPGGYLADKYGRKWLICSMTFVAAFARVFYVFAPTWQWIMVGGIIGGFAAIYQPALNAIVADSLPKEKRGMGFSIINLISSVSTTPAPLLAGYLLSIYGLVPSQRLIYKLVIVGFLVAAALRLRLKETVVNPDRISAGELLRECPKSFRESLNVWSLVPRSALTLFLVDVVMNFTNGLLTPVLTLYMIKDAGISEVGLSYIMTALPVSMIILALPAGKLLDLVGKKKPILAAFPLWAVAMALAVYGGFYRLMLTMVLVGLLLVMYNSAIGALTADLVPSEHRGKVNGSRRFFSLIAASAGNLMGGWMYDNVSHSFPFLIQIALVVIPFILVWLWVEEPAHAE